MAQPDDQARHSYALPGWSWWIMFLAFGGWTAWRLGAFDLWTTITMADGSSIRFPNTFATVDHPFHATRAEVLRRSLADGEILRWIGNHQGGYPVEFYPLGAAWMEVIAWALAFGSLPIMAIHKLVVIAVFLLPIAGFAALARFGKLPWSIPVLAIIIHVSVRGWWWSGGYMELIEWGLLTNVASAALLPLALAWQRNYLRTWRPTLLAGASVVASVAIYTNVRSVLPLAAILVGTALAAALESRRSDLRKFILASIGLVALTALLVAPLAVSLIRFGDLYVFVHYSTYDNLRAYWDSSLQAVSLPVMLLAAAGSVKAVVTRNDDGARTVFIVLVLYVAGTALTIVSSTAANLISQLEATRLMPFQRLLMVYLAAYGVWAIASLVACQAARTGVRAPRGTEEQVIPRLPRNLLPKQGNSLQRSSEQTNTPTSQTRHSRWVEDVGMIAAGLLFISAYLFAWIPGVPASDRAEANIVTTEHAALAELRQQVELADAEAPRGTAILVLGGVVSWHDQLWAPQWSDRRFFYDDWLWYWQTDHVGAYDPLTSHAYDDDASALDDSYLRQHGIGAVVVTGQASGAAATSPLLTLRSSGLWSFYLVIDPTPILTASGEGLLDPQISDSMIRGASAAPQTSFEVRHNWYPRWHATVDGQAASLEKDPAGYMHIETVEPGTELVISYRADGWDWLARIAGIAGICTVLTLLLTSSRFVRFPRSRVSLS